MVKTHSSHEGRCPLPGHQGNHGGKGKGLQWRLVQSQTYLLVFTNRHRLITEYFGIVLMMDESVSLEYAVISGGMPTEEVPSVHQLAVDLVLDKRHQNTRDEKPAYDLQNNHHISWE